MIENVERLVDVKGMGIEFPQELQVVGSTFVTQVEESYLGSPAARTAKSGR